MTSAWTKRAGEQHEFLTTLRREACDAALDQSETSAFFLLLAQELMKHFLKRIGVFVSPPKQASAESLRVRGFCEETLTKIEVWSDTTEEADILKKRFLESTLEFGLSPVESAYLRQRTRGTGEFMLGTEIVSKNR